MDLLIDLLYKPSNFFVLLLIYLKTTYLKHMAFAGVTDLFKGHVQAKGHCWTVSTNNVD